MCYCYCYFNKCVATVSGKFASCSFSAQVYKLCLAWKPVQLVLVPTSSPLTGTQSQLAADWGRIRPVDRVYETPAFAYPFSESFVTFHFHIRKRADYWLIVGLVWPSAPQCSLAHCVSGTSENFEIRSFEYARIENQIKYDISRRRHLASGVIADWPVTPFGVNGRDRKCMPRPAFFNSPLASCASRPVR